MCAAACIAASVPPAAAGGSANPVDATVEALAALNRIRGQAGVAPVGIDPALQAGVEDHSCWMVRNDQLAHVNAGANSNIAVSSVVTQTATAFIDQWATGPYHVTAMLRPHLGATAYGHCTGDAGRWRAAGTLDVLSRLATTPPSPRPLVTFPADGATTHLTTHAPEVPNPLVNCPSVTLAGLPLIVMLPETPSAGTVATLVGPNGPVPVCVITQHDDAHSVGRAILAYDRAVVVIPMVPLTFGAWSASVVSGTRAVSWTFHVDPHALPPGSSPTQGAVPGPIDPAAPAKLVPLEPCRLIDTREETPLYLGGGGSLVLQVAGECEVPPEATAVALTLTSVSPARNGYLTVYPTGTSPPLAATLNVVGGLGTRRANGVLARLGPDGSVTILAHAGGFVVVDVTAAFVPVAESDDGRLVTVTPHRLLDTRDGGRPSPGGTVRVPLPGGVAPDAVAVVVNVSTTQSTGPGFFSAFPAGTARPDASILSTDAAGQTRAASAIVPVNDGGFDVYSHRGDHVIVDFVGWFTGSSAAASSEGLFVSDAPARLVDSRVGWGAWLRGETRVVETGIAGASAVALNVALVGPASPGFLTAFPPGAELPEVTTVNAPASSTAANAAIVAVAGAAFSLYAHPLTHLVIDRVGWFTGSIG